MKDKRIAKVIPVALSGIIMILVGIAGVHHSFLAYGRIECMLFAGYMIAAVCCIAVGIGLLVQVPAISKYIGGGD